MAASITTTQLKTALAERSDICLIDVRRKGDYEKSPATIAESVWHDPEQIEEWRSTLPADKEVVVYCVKGGSVSQSIADALQKSHPHTRFLEGGILQWLEENQS